MGFFDNLSKKATETYKNTTDKTSKMAREMKLKSYIGENKNKIQGIYTEIGRKVYEKHQEGNVSEIEEAIKPELEQIAEVTRKIENMNNEIRAINNLKLCEKCAAEIAIDARFCPSCGAPQQSEEQKQGEVINKPENKIEEVVNSAPQIPVEKEVSAEAEATEEPIEETVPVQEAVNEVVSAQEIVEEIAPVQEPEKQEEVIETTETTESAESAKSSENE